MFKLLTFQLMKFVVNTFRWIAFLLVLAIVFGFMEQGIIWLLIKLISLPFWGILLIVLGGAALFALLQVITMAISSILLIAPKSNTSTFFLGFAILSSFVGTVFTCWSQIDASTGKLILATIFTIIFYGSFMASPVFARSPN